MEHEVQRDESLTVESIMSKATGVQSSSEKAPGSAVGSTPNLKDLISKTTQHNQEPAESAPAVEDTPAEEAEVSSPLDNAIAAKNKNTAGGIIADDGSDDDGALRSVTDTDERRQEILDKMKEFDMLTLKAKAVVGIKKPTSNGEYALMMDDLDKIEIDPNTNEVTFIPDSPWFIRRTEEVESEMKRIKENTPVEPSENNDGEASGTDEEKREYNDINVKEVVEGAEKDRVVHILIDKTGLGGDINFTEEEKDKLATSDLIHLVEVENKDLENISFKKPEPGMSFLSAVNTYQLSVSKVPMTFPASGFKAEMTGLSFGEYSDIALDPGDNSSDFVDYDKMRRRMYVVYTHMVNVSIGEFKTFEEFLDKFAYIDMSLAVYGLLIATQPEKDELTFRCKAGCGKSFNYSYSPRSIIDFDTADIKYLQRIDEINSVAPADRLLLAEQSPVRNIKRIKLPNTGWLVDLHMVSCGEYLSKLIGYVNDIYEQVDGMEENDPQLIDLNKKVAMIPALHAVSAIAINDKDGKWWKLETAEELVNGLLSIPPADFEILMSAIAKYQNNYQVEFNMKHVECTHCHHVTEKMSVTPDDLVFWTAQRLANTEISFDNSLF